MRVTFTVELNLPVASSPDRLPAKIVIDDRDHSLRIIDLLLGDGEDGIPSAPVELGFEPLEPSDELGVA